MVSQISNLFGLFEMKFEVHCISHILPEPSSSCCGEISKVAIL